MGSTPAIIIIGSFALGAVSAVAVMIASLAYYFRKDRRG